MRRSLTTASAVATLLLAACSDSPTSRVSTEPGIPPPAVAARATPLQRSIGLWVAERRAQGLPAPTVSFDFSSAQGSSLSQLRSQTYPPGGGYTYTASTVLQYDGPAQADLDRWPAWTLPDDAAQRLGVESAELMDRYVSRMESLSPGFWDRYEVGSEPRTYTVTESVAVTYADSPSQARMAPADATATVATQDELVFGLSVDGPSWHPSWGFALEAFGEVVQDVDFGLNVDWGLGLRLPVARRLDSPDPVDEGSMYDASSTVQGVNWSAEQYADAGLAAQDGNEWYLFFSTSGCVEMSGIVDLDLCAGPDFERHADFATPFGPGAGFSLPAISVEIADFTAAGIDFQVTPSAGSDKITAEWSIVGEASGSGDLQYTSPTAPVPLSVFAVDGPGTAQYSVDAFRYHFTRFDISFGAKLWVSTPGICFPFLGCTPRFEVEWMRDIGTVDLSDLTGRQDLSVGVHDGTSAPGLTLDVQILNVAPTAVVTLVGGQQAVINGIPMVVGNAGEVFTFTGTSHDPGRDDLTLSWDWGDGTPAPDLSTLYPVPGPTGPNDATDVREHAFDQGCLYDITFTSVDDDGALGEDHASLLITATGNPSRMEGFWQHQLARRGDNLIEADFINCYLATVGLVSSVFDEVRDASTMEAAFEVVNVRQNGGSALEQFDRELLVTWLNFASGAVGYFQWVDTDEDGVADAPLNEAMSAAEAVRLDPSSSSAALRAYTVMLHKISEQFTQDFPN